MNTLILWALGLVGSWVAGRLAGTFAGDCPFAATDWVCLHWGTIAQIGGAILGVLGYGSAKKVATSVTALRTPARPTLAVIPPPEPNPVQTFDPDAIGDADPHSGP